MPRKRNLNTFPPESLPKSTLAEPKSESTSRRKSTSSTTAAPQKDAIQPAVASPLLPEPAASKEPQEPLTKRAPKVVKPKSAVQTTPARTAGARKLASLSDPGVAPRSSAVVGEAFDPKMYRDEIAEVAYTLWEARDDFDGSPEDDWYRAEAEVRRRHGLARSAAA